MKKCKQSDGTFIDKELLEKKVKDAESIALEQHKNKFDDNTCPNCERTEKKLNVVQVLSVENCINRCISEISYKQENQFVLCDDCKKNYEEINRKFSKQ